MGNLSRLPENIAGNIEPADLKSSFPREKQIKKWNRAWKISLIQKENPYWRDLYETLSA